jgi:hypothetical protein
MSFPATVLKVMIASPSDVEAERAICTEEIHRWNAVNALTREMVLLPIKWETNSTPEMGKPAQTVINNQLLEDADILVAIFWTRIGSPTEDYMSGTVEEIKRHVTKGKPAIIYFSDVQANPSSFDQAQYASVNQFRKECSETGLYRTFDTRESFRSLFNQHLHSKLNEAQYQWMSSLVSQTKQTRPELSDLALRILRAATESEDGQIVTQGPTGMLGLSVGREEFVEGDRRGQARCDAALKELESIGAVEQISDVLYRPTDEGYRIIESSQVTVDQFDKEQELHWRSVLDSMTYMQRDLIRFLLLKGGTATGQVIYSGTTNVQGSVDVHGLSRPLIENGLATMTTDNFKGTASFAITDEVKETLKKLLFPRDEGNDTPYFKGIVVPTRK